MRNTTKRYLVVATAVRVGTLLMFEGQRTFPGVVIQAENQKIDKMAWKRGSDEGGERGPE